ncbi:MAG: hypothetical protein METHAR1v1_1060033 [Methanothrix sp.]|nr:MAG: hypothetical protein METHAR1v1_1060033 [Methanothrix sp.]
MVLIDFLINLLYQYFVFSSYG